jgi:hypothetical protein
MARIVRARDPGLVERDRNHLVTAQVANIADVNGDVTRWLPLKIEGYVNGVRKLVIAIVCAERIEGCALRNLARCRQILADVRWVAARSRTEGTSSRVRERTALGRVRIACIKEVLIFGC